jgi:phosphorylase/glycogen(starch) synthase
LACNLSQEINGVSWLHGEVSKNILSGMWPGYFSDELHIGYVTNGVHFHTWTAANLRRLYARYFAEGFSQHQYDIAAWQKVHDIPDAELWSERMLLKQRLIDTVRKRVSDPSQIRFDSPRQMVRIRESLKADTLTIGFARRFATYKRAHLLFTNLERLERIVNNPERPVQFIFAGKAHPDDKPGQDLIKRIVEVAKMPQFAGKIIFLQNYDIDIARQMVQGVDVWLNTPTRPLEASGTSGEKAVMNGVLNFSVLDGWWVEGYREGAGWMLPKKNTFADQRYQDEMDSEMIYACIEEEIAPAYYNRSGDGIPHKWMGYIKKCIADIASNFTTNRMLADYQERYYNKLNERAKNMIAADYTMAREIAAWKECIISRWDGVCVVSVQQFDIDSGAIMMGEKYHVGVVLDINGLKPEDIGVELILSKQIDTDGRVDISEKMELSFVSVEGRHARYALDAIPHQTGTYDMALRIFPKSEKLPHRMDFALVKWV